MAGYDNKYVLDETQIQSIKALDKEFGEALAHSFQLSKELYSYMFESQRWLGTSKDEFMAFYHLMIQYHGWVAGETAPSLGDLSSRVVDFNCAEAMAEAWEILTKGMLDFTSNSESYKELEAIK